MLGVRPLIVIGELLTGAVTVPAPAVAPVPGVNPDVVLYSAMNVPVQLVQVNGSVALLGAVVTVPIVGVVAHTGLKSTLTSSTKIYQRLLADKPWKPIE